MLAYICKDNVLKIRTLTLHGRAKIIQHFYQVWVTKADDSPYVKQEIIRKIKIYVQEGKHKQNEFLFWKFYIKITYLKVNKDASTSIYN